MTMFGRILQRGFYTFTAVLGGLALVMFIRSDHQDIQDFEYASGRLDM